MCEPLSPSEREALARFVTKLVEDVGKVAALLESRGVDGSFPRAAEINLRRTIESLQPMERFEVTFLQNCAGD